MNEPTEPNDPMEPIEPFEPVLGSGSSDRVSSGTSQPQDGDTARKSLRESLEDFLKSLEASGTDLIDLLKSPPTPEESAKLEAEALKRMAAAGFKTRADRERHYAELYETLHELTVAGEEVPEKLGFQLRLEQHAEKLKNEIEKRLAQARKANKNALEEFRRRVASMEEMYRKSLEKAAASYEEDLKSLEEDRAKGPAWIEEGGWIQEQVLRGSEEWQQQCRSKRIAVDLKYYARRREILRAFDRLKENLFTELWEEERRELEKDRVGLLLKIEHLRALVSDAETRGIREADRACEAAKREEVWARSLKRLEDELEKRTVETRQAQRDLEAMQRQLHAEQEIVSSWTLREKAWIEEREALRLASTQRLAKVQDEAAESASEREELWRKERIDLEKALEARENSIDELRAGMLAEQQRLQEDLKESSLRRERIWTAERARIEETLQEREEALGSLRSTLDRLRTMSLRQSRRVVSYREENETWKAQRTQLIAELETRVGELDRLRTFLGGKETEGDPALRAQLWSRSQAAALSELSAQLALAKSESENHVRSLLSYGRRETSWKEDREKLTAELRATDVRLAEALKAADTEKDRIRQEARAGLQAREARWQEERSIFRQEAEALRQASKLKLEDFARLEKAWASQRDGLHTEIQKKEDALAEIRRANEALTADAQRQADNIQSLHERLAQRAAEMRSSEAQRDEALARVESRWKDECVRLEVEIQRSKAKNAELRAAGTATRDELEKAWKEKLDQREEAGRRESAVLEAEIRKRDEALFRLKGDKEKLEAEAALWDENIQSLQNEEEQRAHETAAAQAAHEARLRELDSHWKMECAKLEAKVAERALQVEEARAQAERETERVDARWKAELEARQKAWQGEASLLSEEIALREKRIADARAALEVERTRTEQSISEALQKREALWEQDRRNFEKEVTVRDTAIAKARQVEHSLKVEMEAKFTKAFARRESLWNGERVRLEQKYLTKEAELKEFQQGFEGEIRKAHQRYEAEAVKLRETFAKESAQLHAEFDRKAAQNHQQTEKEITEARQQAKAEVARLKASHKAEFDYVMRERDSLIDSLRAEQDALQRERENFEASRSTEAARHANQWERVKEKFKDSQRIEAEALRRERENLEKSSAHIEEEVSKRMQEMQARHDKTQAELLANIAQREGLWQEERKRLAHKLQASDRQLAEVYQTMQADFDRDRAQYAKASTLREKRWQEEKSTLESNLLANVEALKAAKESLAESRIREGEARNEVRSMLQRLSQKRTYRSSPPPAAPTTPAEPDLLDKQRASLEAQLRGEGDPALPEGENDESARLEKEMREKFEALRGE